jgi:hypothetical protein
MSYEPDQRYSTDRAHRLEIDKPFDEQPRSDRGQFWSVSGSGAAIVAGLVSGWWFARFDPYELEEVVNSFLGVDWFAPICVVVGGVLGFVGAYAPMAYKKD